MSYITPEGLKKLREELEYLRTVKRREISEQIKHSAGFGDLGENAAYQEAKEAQGFLEGRILELSRQLAKAKVVEGKGGVDKVRIGSRVEVESGGQQLSFVIVSSIETDPANGKISIDSLLGSKLLGKKIGKTAEISTLQGKQKYKIIKIW